MGVAMMTVPLLPPPPPLAAKEEECRPRSLIGDWSCACFFPIFGSSKSFKGRRAKLMGWMTAFPVVWSIFWECTVRKK